MTAIARVAFARHSSPSTTSRFVRQLVLFCAAGLFVALLMLTYGVDLSPGFF